MLEKIGLPAKPSAKGRTWVLDASSCQTCQGVFTIFNRKHYCRRCGGLFCGNCTTQRAILRGQGDAPVRICDPCKKLEEAARFQLRNRGKKVVNAASIAEDDSLLKEVLGDEGHALLSGTRESGDDEIDDHHSNRALGKSAHSSKSSSTHVSPSKDGTDEDHDESHFTPEELRSQAIEHKNLYTSLKKQGKNAEALQAYKRSKELGREADALELSLKKMQRKATVEAGQKLKESPESAKDKGHDGTSEGKGRDVSQDSKKMRLSNKDTGDEDLMKTLKDLGWDEADLVEKKPRKGAHSDLDLLAEISDVLPKVASVKETTKENPTQLEILAHKRKALALKREGKPAEAKEELKKAKMLEKKLEEMALFGGEDEDDDEDDDELAKLMKSLEKEAKLDLGKARSEKAPVDFSLPPFLVGDDDANVDVTDDDVHDPSIVAALREMGWEEEAAAMERSGAPSTSGPEALYIASTVSTEASLQSEIVTHKRQALALKREGKIAEAKEQLQDAKTLEQRLQALRRQPSVPTVRAAQSTRGRVRDETQMKLDGIPEDRDDHVVVDEEDERDPEIMAALKAMGYEEDETAPPLQTYVKPSLQEKKNLEDEILAVKRSALALKKSGRIAEAKEELLQARVLEQRLKKRTAELEADGLPKPVTVGSKWGKSTQIPALPLLQTGFVSEDEEEEVEVSAEDFKDPELVTALKSVGWQEEDTFVQDKEPEKAEGPESPPPTVQPYKFVKYTAKDHQKKLQLQKDLLSHKRKALTLKREGKAEEAKAELKLAKTLEKEMDELENAASGRVEAVDGGLLQKSRHDTASLPAPIAYEYEEDAEVTDADMHDPEMLDALKAFGWKAEPETTLVNKPSKSSSSALPALAGLENTVSLKIVLDSGRKPEPTPKELVCFDTSKVGSKKYENPPYSKEAIADTVSDPNWQSILNFSSKRHEEFNEPVGSKSYVLEPQQETSEKRKNDPPVNPAAPVFDHPTPNTNARQKGSQQEPFDLLSGDTWSCPTTVFEGDSDEDEDLFDADMVATLKSIGLALPSFKIGKRPLAESVVDKQAANSRMSVKNETSGPAKDERVEKSGSSLPSTEFKVERVDSRRASASGPIDVSDARQEAVVPAGVNPPPSAGTSDLQEEIKRRKRKAVAFKREGKLAEAREELRQAKLLEKQLETETPATVPDEDLTSAGAPIGRDQPPTRTHHEIPPPAVPTAIQSHKQQMQQQVRQGKDRMKLQRESLAHKRKALGLRREGKMEEAEVEFELAKSLEKQMEELDPAKPAHDDGDMVLVEDLLDPQLMAALTGIGWNETDLSGGRRGSSAPSVSKITQPSTAEIIVSRPASSAIAHEGRTSTSNQAPSRKTPSSTTFSNALEERSGSLSQPPSRKVPVSTTSSNALEERSASMSQPPARQAPSVTAPPEAGPSASRAREERKSTGSVGVGRSSTLNVQDERKKLEDKIKQEKIRAVELKRAGRTREALDVLRGAKQLEKQLETLH